MACTTGQLLRHNLWPQKRSSGGARLPGSWQSISRMKGQKPSDYRVIYIFLSKAFRPKLLARSRRSSADNGPEDYEEASDGFPTNIYAPHQVTSSADGQGYKPQPAGVFARHEVEHIILSEVTSKIIIVVGDCGQSPGQILLHTCRYVGPRAGTYRKVGSWPAWMVTSIRKRNPFQISGWWSIAGARASEREVG